MKNEIQPIQELAATRAKLTGAISQRQNWVSKIDSGEFVVRRKQVNPGASVERALKIGRHNKWRREEPEKIKQRASTAISRITGEIETIDHKSEKFAPAYHEALATKTDQITELSEMAAEGALDETELAPYLKELADLASLPDQLPGLRRGLEKLKTGGEKPTTVFQPATKPEAPAVKSQVEKTAKPVPGPSDEASSKRWLDDYYREDIATPETEKINFKILQLSGNRLKIGKRTIDANSTSSNAGKRIGERRIKVLQALERLQNLGKIPSRTVWEEAFPGEEYNSSVLAAIRTWLIKNISYSGGQVVFYKDLRRGSYFEIPNHNVELIEPGKERETKQQVQKERKQTGKKPFTPQTDDEYALPSGETFKGIRATLVRIAVEELSEYGLYRTIDDLAMAAHGSEIDDRKRSLLTTQWGQVRRLVKEKLGIEIVSTFKPNTFEEQEVRYYRKSIGDVGEPQPVEPVAPLSVETPENQAKRLVPTLEEAALLAGYIELRKDILKSLGITPPPDDLCSKLEEELGWKRERSEEAIQELRRSALQKSLQLIESRLLDKAIDSLEPNDPRADLLAYLLSFQNEAVVIETQSLPEGDLMSAFDFLKLLVESHADLTGELDVRTFHVGDITKVTLTSPHGRSVRIKLSRRPESTPAERLFSEVTSTPVAADIAGVETEGVVFSKVQPEKAETEQPAAEDEKPDQSGVASSHQPTPEELAAEFRAGEKKQTERADPKLVEIFSDDLREFYAQIGGLDPNGVSLRTLQGRFPFIRVSDLRKSFERGRIPRSLKGGQGGVQLTAEVCVRLLFAYRYKDDLATVTAKPYKRALEAAIKKVKKELAVKETEKTA